MNAAQIAPSSGSSGMPQRSDSASNMGSLLSSSGQWAVGSGELIRPARFQPGYRQFGQGLFWLFRWEGLGVVGHRFESLLADILPDADVERFAAAIKRQEQSQGDAGFAGGNRDDEEREDLAVHVTMMARE